MATTGTTAPPDAGSPRLGTLFRGAGGHLLLALLLLVASEPLVVRGGAWSLVTAMFWILVLVAGLFAASQDRATRTIGLSFVAVDFLIHPLAAYDVAPALIHLHSFLVFCILLYSSLFFLGTILRSRRVSTRTLQGGVCVYILLGMIWTQMFLLVDYGYPGSFRFPDGLSSPNVGYVERRRQSMELMYFSFCTLSTVGYGDVTAVRGLARACAVMEAVAGQIYLAVLIGRLVGLQISQSIEESR